MNLDVLALELELLTIAWGTLFPEERRLLVGKYLYNSICLSIGSNGPIGSSVQGKSLWMGKEEGEVNASDE